MTSHKSTPGVADAAWTEQESELLGAARNERMSSHLEARLRDALELQLGAATISGAHDIAPRASSTPPAPAIAGSTSSVLDRSARISQLFASKLPLWGVLSALAIGTFAYLGLRSPAPQVADAGSQAVAVASNAALSGDERESVLARGSAASGDAALGGAAHESGAATGGDAIGGGDVAERRGVRASSAARSGGALGVGAASEDVDPRASGAARGSGRGSSAARGGDSPGVSTANARGDARALSGTRGGDSSEVSMRPMRDDARALSAAHGGNAHAGRAESGDAQAVGSARAYGRAAGAMGDAAAPRATRAAASDRAVVAASDRDVLGAGAKPSSQTGVRGAERRAADASGDAALGGGAVAGRSDVVPSSAASNGEQNAGDELRMEAELLDGARRALSRGALQEARRLLGRYSARFERGVLRPESDVLRIELEMRTGGERAAESHAARFLASYPHHPLRERVRELVASGAQRGVGVAQ